MPDSRAVSNVQGDSRRPRYPGRNPAAALLVLVLAIIVATGTGRNAGESVAKFAADHSSVTSLPAVAAPVATPETGEAAEDRRTPAPSRLIVTPTPATPSRPANELGRIPILMYHAFVHDPANTDDWTITFDQFRDQLDWLRTNDFVMVGLNSVIHRDFSIPAGKRPVILTFDDASAGQFGFRESADGSLEVDPDTAVGALEAYGQQYPEFAGPAFFGVLPFNCFASEGDPSACEERLAWLVDHGYEIGNHTNGHENLTHVSDQRFKDEIVTARQWLDERVDGPNNLSNVLVLPYGAHPAEAYQDAWLSEGFWYYGAPVHLALVLELGGGPAPSPYSTRWTTSQSRYNTDPATFEQWGERITSGEIEVYVSDGDPAVLTIPAGWEEYLNMELIRTDGLSVSMID